MSAQEHEFSALWWHLGPYGRQDVHLHPCARGCLYELVGEGRDCKGHEAQHVVKKLSSVSKWSARANEGRPLTATRSSGRSA